MFRIGDIVQHQTTGKIGKIVGYGCQKRDRTYFMTLKVKPLKGQGFPAFGNCYFKGPLEDTMNE
jgi:hypothetical protein